MCPRRKPLVYFAYFGIAQVLCASPAFAQLKLYETGTPSEYVGLQAPASVTTNFLWTMPAADGGANQCLATNGSGTLSWITPSTAGAAGPSFFVTNGGTNQTVTTGTYAKLTWSTEVFDTNNNFGSSRFTPTVAGKYYIHLKLRCDGTGCNPYIYKNNVAMVEGTADTAGDISMILDMNGTTDYVEAGVWNTGGTIVYGLPFYTYFEGSLLAPLATGSVAGTGTANFVPMWSSGTNLTNSPVAVSGSSVGIGTTSPSTPLHVKGNLTVEEPTAGQARMITLSAATLTNPATILSNSSARMGIGVSNTEMLTMINSGNVGIGVTSPQDVLHIKNPAMTVGDAQLLLEGQTAGYGTGITFQANLSGGALKEMARVVADGDGPWNTTASTQDARLSFWTTLDGATSEKVRISPGGWVGIGTTNPQDPLDIFYSAFRSGGDGTTGDSLRFNSYLLTSRSTTGPASHHVFYNPNGLVGSINTSGSTTIYNTTSDMRLKENFQAPLDPLSRVIQIQVFRYNYKADPDKTPIEGFVAQQLNSVVPYAVTVPEKDYNPDGSINPWQVDYSKVVPLLTAGIQQLKRENEELKEALCELKPDAKFCASRRPASK